MSYFSEETSPNEYRDSQQEMYVSIEKLVKFLPKDFDYEILPDSLSNKFKLKF
jgi:hypothetical protein